MYGRSRFACSARLIENAQTQLLVVIRTPHSTLFERDGDLEDLFKHAKP